MIADLWEQKPSNSFLTAEALGLEPLYYNALIKTLEVFESGQIKWLEDSDDIGLSENEDFKFCGLFNMNYWVDNAPCGTVACIGGSAELIANLRKDSFNVIANANESLHDLFYPHMLDDWWNITVEQGATALRNYLETGRADWESIIEDTD